MKLNNLIQKNINFNSNLIYYLLRYINVDVVYFETNYRNGLIYIFIIA